MSEQQNNMIVDDNDDDHAAVHSVNMPDARVPIFNTLLTFCVSCMTNSSHARVIQLVAMSFDVTEIIDGKRLLCEHSNNILTYKGRNDSILRSEKFAHVEDILDCLKKLDEGSALPLFVTDGKGIERLPKIDAEAFSSISVAEKAAQLDQDLTVLRDTIATAALNRASHDRRLTHLESCSPKSTIPKCITSDLSVSHTNTNVITKTNAVESVAETVTKPSAPPEHIVAQDILSRAMHTLADEQHQDDNSKLRDIGGASVVQLSQPSAIQPPPRIPQSTSRAHQSSLHVNVDEQLPVIGEQFPSSDQLQLLHEQHQQQHANDQQLSPSKQRLTPSTQRAPSSEQRLSPSVRDLPPSTHLPETHDHITSPQKVVHEPLITDRQSPTYSNVLNRKNDIPNGSQQGERDQPYTTAHLFKMEKRLRGTRVEGTAKTVRYVPVTVIIESYLYLVLNVVLLLMILRVIFPNAILSMLMLNKYLVTLLVTDHLN